MDYQNQQQHFHSFWPSFPATTPTHRPLSMILTGGGGNLASSFDTSSLAPNVAADSSSISSGIGTADSTVSSSSSSSLGPPPPQQTQQQQQQQQFGGGGMRKHVIGGGAVTDLFGDAKRGGYRDEEGMLMSSSTASFNPMMMMMSSSGGGGGGFSQSTAAAQMGLPTSVISNASSASPFCQFPVLQSHQYHHPFMNIGPIGGGCVGGGVQFSSPIVQHTNQSSSSLMPLATAAAAVLCVNPPPQSAGSRPSSSSLNDAPPPLPPAPNRAISSSATTVTSSPSSALAFAQHQQQQQQNLLDLSNSVIIPSTNNNNSSAVAASAASVIASMGIVGKATVDFGTGDSFFSQNTNVSVAAMSPVGQQHSPQLNNSQQKQALFHPNLFRPQSDVLMAAHFSPTESVVSKVDQQHGATGLGTLFSGIKFGGSGLNGNCVGDRGVPIIAKIPTEILPPDMSSRSGDRQRLRCQVCHLAASNGLHFGAKTCAACAAFFRRSISDQKKYTCKRSQRCLIRPLKEGGNIMQGYRKMCRNCRMTRCIEIGMLPENVQNKRQRREFFTFADTSSVLLGVNAFSPHSEKQQQHSAGNNGAKLHQQHQMAAGEQMEAAITSAASQQSQQQCGGIGGTLPSSSTMEHHHRRLSPSIHPQQQPQQQMLGAGPNMINKQRQQQQQSSSSPINSQTSMSSIFYSAENKLLNHNDNNCCNTSVLNQGSTVMNDPLERLLANMTVFNSVQQRQQEAIESACGGQSISHHPSATSLHNTFADLTRNCQLGAHDNDGMVTGPWHSVINTARSKNNDAS